MKETDKPRAYAPVGAKEDGRETSHLAIAGFGGDILSSARASLARPRRRGTGRGAHHHQLLLEQPAPEDAASSGAAKDGGEGHAQRQGDAAGRRGPASTRRWFPRLGAFRQRLRPPATRIAGSSERRIEMEMESRKAGRFGRRELKQDPCSLDHVGPSSIQAVKFGTFESESQPASFPMDGLTVVGNAPMPAAHQWRSLTGSIAACRTRWPVGTRGCGVRQPANFLSEQMDNETIAAFIRGIDRAIIPTGRLVPLA